MHKHLRYFVHNLYVRKLLQKLSLQVRRMEEGQRWRKEGTWFNVRRQWRILVCLQNSNTQTVSVLKTSIKIEMHLWSVFIDCDDVCCRMSFEDFCRYFTSIDICHMINTSLISLSKTWKEDIVEGEWKRNRCGGCANNRTFLENPQVRSTMIKTLLTY